MKQRKKFLNSCSGILGNVFVLDENVWDITNVETNQKIHELGKKLKPNQTHILGDAHEFIKEHFNEYDFIWSSRPCQKHTRMVKFTRHKKADYVDGQLFEEIIFLKHFFKGKWVVENVVPYYEILMNPTKIGRHLFWSNFNITEIEIPKPDNFINLTNVAGKKKLQDWLGIHFEENIYYGNNHCPAQILRNAVHPLLGKHIVECSEPQPTQY